MKFIKRLTKNKKAISPLVATIMLIAITTTAAGVLFSSLAKITRLDSDVEQGGVMTASDEDGDGKIDRIRIPLINKGMRDAIVERVVIIQDGERFLWHTPLSSIRPSVRISTFELMVIIPIDPIQQIESLKNFKIEIVFQDGTYISQGLFAASPISEDEGGEGGEGGEEPDHHNYLVLRTEEDDSNHCKDDFPADLGFSPTLWFVLGMFDHDNKRPDLNFDFINLCGYGNEEDFTPYIFDNRQFTEGNIDFCSNGLASPYNDSYDDPATHIEGLVSFTQGDWDNNDDLDWDAGSKKVKGIVYMWSYIYLPGEESLDLYFGANAAKEFKLWVNGNYLLSGDDSSEWYTTSSLITLNPGLNLIMLKVKPKNIGQGVGNSRLAGQVLLFNSLITEKIATMYSLWPTAADLGY